MITKEDFIKRVKAEVFPALRATNKERKMTLLKAFLIIAVGLLIIFLDFYLFHNRSESFVKAVFFVGLIFVGIGFYLCRCFVAKQKARFSPVFLRFLGDLKNKQNVINNTLLSKSLLFSPFEKVETDDEISGIFKDTRFAVSERELIHRTTSGKQEHEKTVFSGIIVNIPMKKSGHGYTLLFNKRWPVFGLKLQKINLESPVFRRHYQTYSENQIDARVLLTPYFMERLENLKHRFKGRRIDVSFFGNRALFAIYTRKNLFESYSLFRSPTNIKTYEKFYDGIHAIYDMVEILNIDNKDLGKFDKDDKTAEELVDALYEEIKEKKETYSVFKLLILFPIGLFLFFFLFDFLIGLCLKVEHYFNR